MKHPVKSLLIVLFTIFVCYSTISHSQNKSKSQTSQGSIVYKSEFLQDVIDKVKKDYVEEKTDEDLVKAAASGILSSLDPHSSYLSEDDFKEIQVQTKGEFGGVGIEITMEYSLVKVVSAIEGTPAEKAGIKSGDYISRVDGKTVVGSKIDEVVKKLRGKPGTKVAVTILRKDEKAPIEVVLQRQNIQIKAVRSSKEDDVAYIKINSFSEQASSGAIADLKKLINQIGKNKIKGIVLDLRGNPGGLLDEAVRVSDIFLDKDQTIVSIAGRNKDDTKLYKDSENQSLTKNIPVVVLINEGSASASEIVAGALQDHKRAIILGQKSFGKGSVQSVVPLESKQGALKLTTALYYTPSGKSIQAQGIDPDILVADAKIEVNGNGLDSSNSEASLEGHLKNQIQKEIKSANQIGDDNLELYNKDYQLARAVDLLRGISVYRAIKK